MKKIYKGADGSFTVVLHLTAEERKRLKKLGQSLEMNDFETLKYALQLVSWWSRNEIEPEREDELSSAI